MENKIIPFNYGDSLIRIVKDESTGEPLWVAKDICSVFGEQNYRRAVSRLDDDEKGVSQINTPGGMQNMTVVNESGMYSMLFYMQPQKGNAPHSKERELQLKKFKRWVTHEVLPTIRKTGSYGTADMNGITKSMNAIAHGFTTMTNMMQTMMENLNSTNKAYLTPDQLDQIKLKASAAARALSECHSQLTWGEAMRYVYMELNSRMGVFSYTHISGHDYEDAIILLDCMKLAKEIEAQSGIKQTVNDLIQQAKAYK